MAHPMVVATTTSNLVLSYAIASGPASISGNMATLEGTVVVEVRQGGDATFNSASASTSFNVTLNIDPCTDFMVELTSTSDVVAGNDGAADILVSGGTTPYNFSWSKGTDAEDLANVAGGDYTVTVTDANNCTQTLDVTIGDIVLATESDIAATTINYYPNPVNDYMTVTATFEKATTVELQVIDLSGRVMMGKVYPETESLHTELDLKFLKSGQYLLRIIAGTQTKTE